MKTEALDTCWLVPVVKKVFKGIIPCWWWQCLFVVVVAVVVFVSSILVLYRYRQRQRQSQLRRRDWMGFLDCPGQPTPSVFEQQETTRVPFRIYIFIPLLQRKSVCVVRCRPLVKFPIGQIRQDGHLKRELRLIEFVVLVVVDVFVIAFVVVVQSMSISRQR